MWYSWPAGDSGEIPRKISPDERWKWLPAELKNLPIVPFPEPGGPKMSTDRKGALGGGDVDSFIIGKVQKKIKLSN